MTTLREAAEMALEALDCIYSPLHVREIDKVGKAMNALRAALAQPEPEPVAIVVAAEYEDGSHAGHRLEWRGRNEANDYPEGTEFYITPPAQRQPLTDDEIDKVTDAQWAQNNHKPIYAAHRAYARAIEQAHGIGEKE